MRLAEKFLKLLQQLSFTLYGQNHLFSNIICTDRSDDKNIYEQFIKDSILLNVTIYEASRSLKIFRGPGSVTSERKCAKLESDFCSVSERVNTESAY